VAYVTLIDREADVEALVRRVRQTRLVTLTGPGGVGKTRLALQVLVSAAAAGLATGTRVATLDDANDERTLIAVVATALGIGAPASIDDLVSQIPDEHCLLLLDGYQQIRSACARIAAALLHTSARLRVIATGLEPLDLPGEQCWPVAPLSVPGVDTAPPEIARADSVRLFVERLSTAQPQFRLSEANASVVARLCRRVDGLPLAIELAAGQVALLGLDQVAALVDEHSGLLTNPQRGTPSRHHSLTTTIARGWGVLDADEQRVLCRLATFSGGWTLSAAEAVCADTRVPTFAMLDFHQRLVTKSAVLAELGERHMRYHLLQGVREFALERLSAHESLELRQAHLNWCIDIAVADASLGRLDAELDNIRAALEWASLNQRDSDGLRLATACAPIWLYRGHAEEGLQWLARLLSTPRPIASAIQAEAECVAAELSTALGDTEAALARLSVAVTLASEADDRLLEARVQRFLGEMHLRRANFHAARAAFAAAESFLQSDADSLAVHVQARLAIACLEEGDSVAGRAHLSLAMALAEASGHPGLLARAEAAAGVFAHREGALGRAAAAFAQAAANAGRVNWLPLLSDATVGLVRVQLDRHRVSEARPLVAQLVALAANPSVRWLWPHILEVAAELAAPVDPARAARLGGAAESLGARFGYTRWPSEGARHERWRARVQAQLGLRWLDAWRAGEQMEPEQALQEASVIATSSPRPIDDATAIDSLSPREREVADLVARGLSNRAIAERLTLSEATVRVHVEHILDKLGLRSRVQVRRRLRLAQAED
jgi:non-specific serine/threonine protein kinase